MTKSPTSRSPVDQKNSQISDEQGPTATLLTSIQRGLRSIEGKINQLDRSIRWVLLFLVGITGIALLPLIASLMRWISQMAARSDSTRPNMPFENSWLQINIAGIFPFLLIAVSGTILILFLASRDRQDPVRDEISTIKEQVSQINNRLKGQQGSIDYLQYKVREVKDDDKGMLNHQPLINNKLKCELENLNHLRTSFSRRDLSKAKLAGIRLEAADLRSANLQEADLTSSRLNEANLMDANLRTAKMFRSELNEAVLHRADLREAVLTEAELRKADLSDACLFDAYLSSANCTSAKFRGADLSKSYLPKTNLNETDLVRVKLIEAILIEAKMGCADLSYADLTGARLTEAKMEGSKLVGTCLNRAELDKADLSGARLINANLSDANLRKANLRGADLSGANLSGADLTKIEFNDQTNFTGANLTNVRWCRVLEEYVRSTQTAAPPNEPLN